MSPSTDEQSSLYIQWLIAQRVLDSSSSPTMRSPAPSYEQQMSIGLMKHSVIDAAPDRLNRAYNARQREDTPIVQVQEHTCIVHNCVSLRYLGIMVSADDQVSYLSEAYARCCAKHHHVTPVNPVQESFNSLAYCSLLLALLSLLSVIRGGASGRICPSGVLVEDRVVITGQRCTRVLTEDVVRVLIDQINCTSYGVDTVS